MHHIKREVDIAAPPARVFDYVTHPANFPSVWPSMLEVSNVKRRDDGWNEFDCVYKMAGLKLREHVRVTRIEPNALVETETDGPVRTTFDWRFAGADGATHLTLDVAYAMTTPLFGGIGEAIAAKLNEREADVLLANLKKALEA